MTRPLFRSYLIPALLESLCIECLAQNWPPTWCGISTLRSGRLGGVERGGSAPIYTDREDTRAPEAPPNSSRWALCMMAESKVDVLIIGAGPAGLMCANALAHAKIPVRIIDKR